MKRVIITQCWAGLCHMQVCVGDDATDEEILEVCNRENPAGTIFGWTRVIRNDPVQCETYPERIHYMVAC